MTWLNRFTWAFLVAWTALAALVAAVVGPYVRDDIALDQTVRAVALDWRDFGEDRARERLLYELDHRAIGAQVGDDDCRLREEGDARVVRCAWRASIPIPGTAWAIPLRFGSAAAVAPDGDIL